MKLHDTEVITINGEKKTLADYAGKTLLIVNTATACGLTPQFEGLEALHQRFKDRGFAVLGFPCNQFAGQEPLDEAGIQAACKRNYGVTFPLFSKIEVNGPGAHPLFRKLKSEAPGFAGIEAIKWNFTKFLVDKSGKVVDRFGPKEEPEDIAGKIEKVLPAAAA
jgi:glutathione peroxidase